MCDCADCKRPYAYRLRQEGEPRKTWSIAVVRMGEGSNSVHHSRTFCFECSEKWKSMEALEQFVRDQLAERERSAPDFIGERSF